MEGLIYCLGIIFMVIIGLLLLAMICACISVFFLSRDLDPYEGNPFGEPDEEDEGLDGE